MAEGRATSIRLGRQFSIVMLFGAQFFVCWLSLLLWKGLYSFSDAAVNVSQVSLAVALIVASLIWRRWYLVFAASGLLIDSFAYGLSVIEKRWLMQVSQSGADRIPTILFVVLNVQFYIILMAQFLTIAGVIGFLRDVWLGKYEHRTQSKTAADV
jgi:hypothetical protein